MPNNLSRPPSNRQRRPSFLAALLFAAAAVGALPVRAQYVNWTNSQTPATGSSPKSIVVGDFNGDGIADIAVGQTNSVGILVGNGNGTFKAVNNITTPFTPQAIAGAAFVNGASEGIIAVSSSATPTNNAVTILSNGSGGETVQAPFSLPFGSASSIATGDFNGDGNQDFAVTFQNSNKVSIFLGNGNGTFGIPTTYATGNGPSLVVVGNFSGHGMKDLAIINSTDKTISILLNNGSGIFTAGPTITDADLGTSGPTSMTVGDFNGDGIQDLAVVVSGGSEAGVAIIPGKGAGAFGAPTIIPILGTGAGQSGIAAGDFTGSGALDVVAFNEAYGNAISLFQNDGIGDFSQGPSPTAGNDPWVMATGNFNGGTTADLAVVNSSDGTVSILLTAAPSVAPAFTLPASPSTATITSGRSVAFNVLATGVPAPTYQWTLNGSTTIPGASVTTDRILLISGATSANVGNYVCTATNSQGSVQTTATLSSVTTYTLSDNSERPTAMLTSATPGYLTNLSSRVTVGTGGNVLIAGFALAGSGTMDLLLRGVGPALIPAPFSVSGALTNTQLTMYDTVIPTNPQPIVTNSGWSNGFTLGTSTVSVAPQAATLALMNTLGAFTLNWTVGSADSALEVTPPVGGYTAQISGVGGATGIALAEVYDVDAYNPATRLVNVSTRAQVGTGNNILIGGFTIGGTTDETVLVRGVGPTLASYGVPGAIAQPVLGVYSGTTAIYTNTSWGGDATINGVFGTVGAFALNTSSPDCALLITLPPGGYTAEVSGVNSTTGIALVEVYEVY